MSTFNQFDFAAPIDQALKKMNFLEPTPIQEKAIPAALQGKDVLGIAQTGTGKTAAFVLPILNRLTVNKAKAKRFCPRALILAPTRELIVQIGEGIQSHGEFLHLRHSLIYGGVSQNPQARALKQGVHLVAATPGRLLDLMNQKLVDLRQLEMLVLDEVDRMLDMGFMPDIKRIIQDIPDNRQSLFFSATLPSDIRELANKLLTDPVVANVSPKTKTVKKIKQRILFVENGDKLQLLKQLLAGPDVGKAVVFAGTKRKANSICEKLERDGFRSAAIHGNKSQNARQKALDAFQGEKIQILVATDVAARGIDISGITHVVNFDIPKEPDSYVHRIGRTGRAGESGIAVSFCSHQEKRELRAIEQTIRQRIPAEVAEVQPRSNSDKDSSSKPEKRKKRGQRTNRPEPSSSKSVRQSGQSRNRNSSDSNSGDSIKSKSKFKFKVKRKSKPKRRKGSTEAAVTTARSESNQSSSRRKNRSQKSFGFNIQMDQ